MISLYIIGAILLNVSAMELVYNIKNKQTISEDEQQYEEPYTQEDSL